MGRNAIRASIQCQRAVNQAIIYASRVPASHISRLEKDAVDPKMGTLRKLFDAMFCDLIILPIPRQRPGDALTERRLNGARERRLWD